MFKRIISIALKALALAMGAVVVILSILGTLNIEAAIPLLGIGLAALGLEALQKEDPGSVLSK